mmetsp:Transcript_3273/g.5075  ORF Transcript_3273/g.5075 Transcript_3273/m.5075 type:complete len:334 (-) Transcript_3273:43-1044(-)
MTPEKTKSIIVKNIPYDVTQSKIQEVFEKFGSIDGIRIVKSHRFYCFIDYKSEASAEEACNNQSTILDDNEVKIEFKRPMRTEKTPTQKNSIREPASNDRFIVAKFDQNQVLHKEISELFSEYGKILHIKFVKPFKGKSNKKKAIILFKDAESASNVLKSGPFKIKDEEIVVKAREPKPNQVFNEQAPVGPSNAISVEHLEQELASKALKSKVAPLPKNSIHIKGFPENTTNEMIREAFSPYGNIVSIILRIKHTKESVVLTWSFVEYDNMKSVEDAIKNTGQGFKLNGAEVTVEARKSEPKLYRNYNRRRMYLPNKGRRRSYPEKSDTEEGV